MKVTRVELNRLTDAKSLAYCSVVVDDSLMLTGINLYKGQKGYYLVLPSKQDIYKSISELNENYDIIYPQNAKDTKSIKNNKKFEEFYHPVTKKFYDELLNSIVCVYESTNKNVI